MICNLCEKDVPVIVEFTHEYQLGTLFADVCPECNDLNEDYVAFSIIEKRIEERKPKKLTIDDLSIVLRK
jgi:hypothetical protein